MYVNFYYKGAGGGGGEGTPFSPEAGHKKENGLIHGRNHGRSPAFLEGGGNIGQGAPFDSREYVVRFRQIRGGGGG